MICLEYDCTWFARFFNVPTTARDFVYIASLACVDHKMAITTGKPSVSVYGNEDNVCVRVLRTRRETMLRKAKSGCNRKVAIFLSLSLFVDNILSCRGTFPNLYFREKIEDGKR